MANTSISGLSAAASVGATDIFPTVQTAGIGPVKATAAQMKTFVLGAGDTLPVANGGTGLTSLTAGRIPFGAGTSAFGSSVDLFWDSANARLGIGTLTPSTKLTIQNPNTGSTGLARQLLLRTGDETNFYRTCLVYNDGAAASGMFPGYSGGLYHEKGGAFATGSGFMVGTGASAGPLMFGTADTERARIDLANGYLLVGYTASNGAYRLQVNSQIFATSSTIATSDGRYKENVEPITGALNIVRALNPVSFNWKQHPVHNFDLEHKTVGFIAQEVQTALSDKPYVAAIIKQNECELPDGTKEEFLGIAEGNMIAILTAAIKELKAEFDAYKSSHP
jgi:hypothetical protein